MSPPSRPGRNLLTSVGVLEILFGGVLAALAAVIALAALAAGSGPAPEGSAGSESLARVGLAADAVVCSLAALFFVAMGVGTIRAKRWARALMLVVCWPWLLTAALFAILAAVFLPALRGLVAEAAPDPSVAGPVVTVLGVLLLLQALIPLGLVLFYTRSAVRLAFDTRDPHPDWTDGRPLSVLALALVMWCGGAGSLLSGIVGRSVLLFGHSLARTGAIAAAAILAVVWCWLGWAIYRLKSWALWPNILFVTAIHLSWWMDLRRQGLAGFLGLGSGDLAALPPVARQAWMQSGAAWIAILSAAIWIAVLVWLRPHLAPSAARSPALPESDGPGRN